MSAETLREAARDMRNRANACESVHRDQGWYEPTALSSRSIMSATDNAHIASWHPAVALAVADWLESAICGCDENCVPPLALAVAHAYLGESA